MNKVIENTWSFAASRSWQAYGVALAVASCALAFFSEGNFWLDLLSSVLIGSAAFCFGAAFHEHTTTCTCPEESETN